MRVCGGMHILCACCVTCVFVILCVYYTIIGFYREILLMNLFVKEEKYVHSKLLMESWRHIWYLYSSKLYSTRERGIFAAPNKRIKKKKLKKERA